MGWISSIAGWAQKCADHGIALDFRFPAPAGDVPTRQVGGHNLYDERYAMDFGRLAEALLSGKDPLAATERTGESAPLVCECLACSPVSPSTEIHHGNLEKAAALNIPTTTVEDAIPPFTRAYIHHLLHTHEMTAHTFLVSHNLSVLEAFFRGIRNLLTADIETQSNSFVAEVQRFVEVYDEDALCGITGVLEAGRTSWRVVEDMRGKGRLKREKEVADALVESLDA